MGLPFHDLLLDLNHDGTNDFNLINKGTSGFFYPYLRAQGAAPGNGVLATGPGGSIFALRLTKGAEVGPGGLFESNVLMVSGLSGGHWLPYSSRPITGFLGFQFDIDGQAHYGWAAMTVAFGRFRDIGGFRGGLTGYAYDTVPGQAITAGEGQTPEPGTLGLLALGSLGLGFSRRRKAVASQQ